MPVVLDASVAVAILAVTQSTRAVEAFVASAPADLLAPALLTYELRHAILRLERRGLLARGEADVDLRSLEGALEIQPAPTPDVLASWLQLAREQALGLYDAAYLHLALARGADLASRDGPLLEAARRRHVVVRDLR